MMRRIVSDIRRGARGGQRRRASNLLVPETKAGLLAWFQPASDYVTKDGSNRVSGFEDRYSGYSAEQASGPAQPLWSATGIGGKPAIFYDGARYLSTQDGVLAGLLDASAPFTSFAVVDRDSNPPDTIWALGTAASSTNLIDVRFTGASPTSTDFAARIASGAATTNLGTQTDNEAAGLLVTTYSGTQYNSWVNNNASLISAANTRAPVCDRFFLGAGWYSGAINAPMHDWIGDVILYDSVLSAGDIADVTQYLSDYYGLGL